MSSHRFWSKTYSPFLGCYHLPEEAKILLSVRKGQLASPPLLPSLACLVRGRTSPGAQRHLWDEGLKLSPAPERLLVLSG